MKLLKLDIQMFADGKVEIETDLNEKGFKNGLSKIQSIAKTGFGIIATSIGAVSGAMATAIGFGVKYNAEIEQLETSFEVMTGSADKAKETIQKLKDVGAKTPYELKGLAQTTQTLMQYGLSADEAYEATLNLGDISQGSAEKMQSIALAYGQMSSAGKVNMQDIKQMINAGFNPLQAIMQMTGETMEQVTARYEAGKISVEEVTKAMQYASGENGRYYQSMEKQSKTLTGQLSTLKDNVSSLAGTLSQGLANSISNGALPAINDLISGLETAFTEGGIEGFAEKLGTGIADMVTKISEEAPKFIEIALLIIENLIKGIEKNLPAVMKGIMKVITLIVESFIKMLPEILKIGIQIIIELIKGIAEALPTLIPTIVEAVILMVETLIDNIDLIIDAGIQLIFGLIDGIIEALPILIDKIPEIIEKLLTAITKNLPKIIEMGITLTIKLAEGLIKAIPQLIKNIPKIITGIVNALGEGVKSIAKVGANLMTGLWNGIKEKWENLKSKVSSLANGIVNKFKSVFGIKSPSRVFRDQIGKQLSAGIGVGFEDELDNVYRDMQKAIDFETSKMSANVQSSGTYQVAMAGTPQFNLLDNTENTTQLVVNGKVLAEVVNTENRNREVARA